MPTSPGRPASTDAGGPHALLSLLMGWMQRASGPFPGTEAGLAEPAMGQAPAAKKNARRPLSLRPSSLAVLTDLALDGSSSFIEAQKILLLLAQEKSEAHGTTREVPGPEAEPVTADVLRQSRDSLLKMQQNFLKTSTRQTLEWLKEIEAGTQPAGIQRIRSAQQGVQNFVHQQKTFLRVIAPDTSSKRGRGVVAGRTRDAVLSKLAREATEAFVEAQSRMLDVVVDQVKLNLKAATRSMEPGSAAGLLPTTKVAGDALKSFVAVEKALIESTVRPSKASMMVAMKPHGPERASSPGRGRKTRAMRIGA